MKTTVMLFLAVLTGGLMLASAASAQIRGTAHDFSDGVGFELAGVTDTCSACHVAHQAVYQADQPAAGPLWDRTLSTASWTPYVNNNSTLEASVAADVGAVGWAPGPISILCLSCHDGTVAWDDHSHNPNGTGTDFLTNTDPAFVGFKLTGSHPIGFEFTDAVATSHTELFPPTSTNVLALSGNIDATMLFDNGAGANTLLECASCHDVHGTGNPSLLVIDNAASALCLTCHDK